VDASAPAHAGALLRSLDVYCVKDDDGSMRRGKVMAGLMASAGFALATSAYAAESTHVDANGNAFTGGMNFSPRDVRVPIGGVVVWTNRDFLVPHTATEDHGLWNLTGTYGGTPLNPPGFGPGATVQRAFEAGTAKYFCEVHPVEMRGTVAVPVALALDKRVVRRRVRRAGRRTRTRRLVIRTVVATWAVKPPANGHVFDAEVRRGEGPWHPLAAGTRQLGGRIDAGKVGTVTHVRARLRSATEPVKATDWSPDASLRSG
jgi:plastocyanin